MKKLLLITISLLFVLNSYSQTGISLDTLKKSKKNYFGINAGFTTGVGFSYIFFPKKVGVQITFLPYYKQYLASSKTDNSSDIFLYSAGLTFLLSLKEHKKARFCLYLGNHVNNLFSENNNLVYNIGFGPCIEFGSEYIKVQAKVGYAVLGIPDKTLVFATSELGLFYKF